VKSILIDTGPLISLFSKGDRYHRAISEFLRVKVYRFVTTLAVLTEVTHFLSANHKMLLDFFNWVMDKGVILYEITLNDMPRIVELTRKYADRPMDFADATLVIAAEKTGIHEIISIDSDFDIYRLMNTLRIRNLFKEDAP
jgi:predicted nucleic acid-binding protein